MGNVVSFVHHARASSTTWRAAKTVKVSAVTELPEATSVAKMADHHSAGMLSRCPHFETADGLAPISAAIASLEGQRSIRARKEGSFVIGDVIGHSVLKRKVNLSLDYNKTLGHTVRMAEADTEAQFKQEFMQRVAAARVARNLKQWQIAEALGMSQDKYKQYEGRSYLPHHLIGRFCIITRVDPVWLMTGRGEKPLKALEVVEEAPEPVTKPKRRKGRQAA